MVVGIILIEFTTSFREADDWGRMLKLDFGLGVICLTVSSFDGWNGSSGGFFSWEGAIAVAGVIDRGVVTDTEVGVMETADGVIETELGVIVKELCVEERELEVKDKIFDANAADEVKIFPSEVVAGPEAAAGGVEDVDTIFFAERILCCKLTS